jgi:putative transposase
VDRADPDVALTEQATLLTLSRSSLYYRPVGPSAEEVALKHRIDEIYTATPFYGARRIAAQLALEGQPVNRKTVARYMAEMRLTAIYPGPNLSKRAAQAGVYPYLLRNLPIARVNQVWGVDITYVRAPGGWLYLVAVLDWFSRYVLSWELDQTLAQPFVTTAVQQALAQATPDIWNSDQGSHFTSPQYTDLLKAAGVRISMDGRGRALDNIFTERLWRTVKYEHIYLHDYTSIREARAGLRAYFDFYNHRRLHQALGYRPPAAVYAERPGGGNVDSSCGPTHIPPTPTTDDGNRLAERSQSTEVRPRSWTPLRVRVS